VIKTLLLAKTEGHEWKFRVSLRTRKV